MLRLLVGALIGAALVGGAVWSTGLLRSALVPPSAARAAEFRYLAKEAIEAVDTPCRLSRSADNDVILARPREALRRYREQLGDTVDAKHFRIAEADVEYMKTLILVECRPPDDRRGSKTVTQDVLDTAKQRLSLLETKFPASP